MPATATSTRKQGWEQRGQGPGGACCWLLTRDAGRWAAVGVVVWVLLSGGGRLWGQKKSEKTLCGVCFGGFFFFARAHGPAQVHERNQPTSFACASPCNHHQTTTPASSVSQRSWWQLRHRRACHTVFSRRLSEGMNLRFDEASRRRVRVCFAVVCCSSTCGVLCVVCVFVVSAAASGHFHLP